MAWRNSCAKTFRSRARLRNSSLKITKGVAGAADSSAAIACSRVSLAISPCDHVATPTRSFGMISISSQRIGRAKSRITISKSCEKSVVDARSACCNGSTKAKSQGPTAARVSPAPYRVCNRREISAWICPVKTSPFAPNGKGPPCDSRKTTTACAGSTLAFIASVNSVLSPMRGGRSASRCSARKAINSSINCCASLISRPWGPA